MLLEKINSPNDLKRIPLFQLATVAKEIRQLIINVVSQTGGHLASSLGVVDLTVALHYCFDAPKDIIAWDVGHQCYAHKILTGRRDQFSSLRTYKGISGFPLKEESVYDPFSVGHSSTAVSLALGFAAARDLKKSDEKVVAIIGDGSLSGGMCFEALNNAGHLKTDLLVILNTNEMNISPAVGALSNYLNKIISGPVYNRYKTAFEHFISLKVPHIGPRLVKLSIRFEEIIKALLIPGIFFEELGFRYFGPLDGHNIEQLVETLNNLKTLKGPLLLHITTKKGKGYLPAEKQPERFHGAGKFDIKDGSPIQEAGRPPTFTQVFSEKLVQLAKEDASILAVTAAMSEGTGLENFAKEFPKRFFDVGIAEEHAVSFAAGLAAKGAKPVVAIYSTFLQRSYDQLMIDLALQNLNVVIAIDRAGIVGADGFTHQGIFDIAYLRSIPNMIVLAPKDAQELGDMLEFSLKQAGPVAIRYPKSTVPVFDIKNSKSTDISSPEILKPAREITIVALGSMAYPAFEASKILVQEGIKVGVINARSAKPLDEKFYNSLTKTAQTIITVEEGIVDGGFGSGIKSLLADKARIKIIGLPTAFIAHGERSVLLEEYGLSPTKIAQSIREIVSEHKVASRE